MTRFLFLHNNYRIRGGEEESREQEISILRSKGHEVLEHITDSASITSRSIGSVALESIWNRRQYRTVKDLIRRFSPDILKVDNYVPLLSTSVFQAAKDSGVPAVLSVRNYRLICPSATLFRQGNFCKDCVGRTVAWPAVTHACCADSRLRSSVAVAGSTLAWMTSTWTANVTHFFAVSSFVRDILVEGGIPADRISVKPNSVADRGVGKGGGSYFVHAGRLVHEKGILTLLAAWERLETPVRLKIIGEGECESRVMDAARKNPNIEYLGRLTLAEVTDVLGEAMALIFPSEWMEPFGRSIIEAFSRGTPVIGAATIPVSRMISEGYTGLYFSPGDPDHLARVLTQCIERPELLEAMRGNCRSEYLLKYTEEANYNAMMKVFDKVTAKHSDE